MIRYPSHVLNKLACTNMLATNKVLRAILSKHRCFWPLWDTKTAANGCNIAIGNKTLKKTTEHLKQQHAATVIGKMILAWIIFQEMSNIGDNLTRVVWWFHWQYMEWIHLIFPSVLIVFGKGVLSTMTIPLGRQPEWKCSIMIHIRRVAPDVTWFFWVFTGIFFAVWDALWWCHASALRWLRFILSLSAIGGGSNGNQYKYLDTHTHHMRITHSKNDLCQNIGYWPSVSTCYASATKSNKSDLSTQPLNARSWLQPMHGACHLSPWSSDTVADPHGGMATPCVNSFTDYQTKALSLLVSQH